MPKHSAEGSRKGPQPFSFQAHSLNVHPPVLDSRRGPSPYVQPGPSFPHTYCANAASFYQHPLAAGGSPYNGHEEPARASPAHHTPRTAGVGVSMGVSSKMRVSLTAKQLANQLIESKNFWVTFQQKYEKEIASIKAYVDDDILQQIWQKKVEYNGKHNSGENQEDGQFNIQYMKLVSCLDQINEAATMLASTKPSDHRSDKGSQSRHLKKIHTNGSAVAELAAKSMTDSAACTDLLAEISELQKLVDPRNPTAKVLHPFDKRKPKKSDRSAPSPEPVTGDSEDQVNQSATLAGAELCDNQGESDQASSSAEHKSRHNQDQSNEEGDQHEGRGW
ncbi:hypothetical protein F4779DRAFT_370943 [Xylariaceae sp. FL0662B]|nr:hypothetical protein F4779DRAFT_370943 [Xylariaceae sp. FL0662B]